MLQSTLSASSSAVPLVSLKTLLPTSLYCPTAFSVSTQNIHTHAYRFQLNQQLQRCSDGQEYMLYVHPQNIHTHSRVLNTCAFFQDIALMISCLISRTALHTSAYTSCKPLKPIIMSRSSNEIDQNRSFLRMYSFQKGCGGREERVEC